MNRLLAKFETAKSLVPGPVVHPAKRATPYGVIYYGSTTPAMNEALLMLDAKDVQIDAMRVRAFPFSAEVADFIAAHETVFVVEQNRDGQLRTLIITEEGIDPGKLPAILSFDGAPITARTIVGEILAAVTSGKEARQ